MSDKTKTLEPSRKPEPQQDCGRAAVHGAQAAVQYSGSLAAFQSAAGNMAIQRLFKSGAVQAKLRIGSPGDAYEREADRVADQVLRMPVPGVQRKPT